MNNVDFDELLKQGVLCSKKMVPVYCTTDLSIFKENDLNRNIRRNKVNEFVVKIQEHTFETAPYLTVLPDMRIADGHHRIKAIKEYLSQKDCPVKEFPVWFMVTDNEEYLHNCNTAGSMWNHSNHISYYYKLGKIHYVYLKDSINEIINKQKDMHIACKIGQPEITKIMKCSMSGGNGKYYKTARGEFDIQTGNMKILIKKECILDILPYYKDIQTLPAFQRMLTTNADSRQSLLVFLTVLNCLGADVNYITTTIMGLKKNSPVFSPVDARAQGGIKEVLFNSLGVRLKRKIFKQLGELMDIDVSKLQDDEMTFYRILRCFITLANTGFFRPENVWKQEEIMNRMEQEELMNQKQ